MDRTEDRTLSFAHRLRGGWRTAAQVAWLLVAALTLATFIASLPDAYAKYTAVCATSCGAGDLTPAGVREIESLGLSVEFFAGVFIVLECLFVATAAVVAALIFWHRSDEGAALLIALFLVTFSAALFFDPGAQSGPWRAPVAAIVLIGWMLFLLFLLIFPDGRFVPRWSGLLVLAVAASALANLAAPDTPLLRALDPLTSRNSLAVLASGIGAQLYRYWRVSGATQRQQTRWVVLGAATAISVVAAVQITTPLFGSSSVVFPLASAAAVYLALLLIPISIGVAVLWYRLWDIRILLNRTLVYVLLTACVIAVYGLTVGGLSALFQASGSFAITLAATGVVALAVQPLRERLQRGVNRMLYGERDDPYTVLERLGRRLEAAAAPETMLPAIVETVAQALKLPYAAIGLDQDGMCLTAAATGAPVPGTIYMPLVAHGEWIGQLILGPRAPGEAFSATDRRLLDNLARQVASAASAARLADERRQIAADLQRSREQLVLAREEERRRLRRDLHDGLGPTLAALSLAAGTVADMIPADPSAAVRLATELGEEIRTTVGDIRRLVYDLRPPALDELGLAEAVRQLADQLSRHVARGPGLQIGVRAPEQLPPLPAAVEVAAYRIVQEALTNVARHAQARSCSVQLTPREQALELTIDDDGAGLPPERSAGVGLLSMRERARELGGEFRIAPRPHGGTRVWARLPL